jgi:hypothetical protein
MAATAIELRRPGQLRDRRRARLVRASDRMNRARRELGSFRQTEGYLPLPDGINLVRILSGYGSTVHAQLELVKYSNLIGLISPACRKFVPRASMDGKRIRPFAGRHQCWRQCYGR